MNKWNRCHPDALDTFVAEHRDELSDLLEAARDHVDPLAPYANGGRYDTDALLLGGTQAAIKAWRDSRPDAARFAQLADVYVSMWKGTVANPAAGQAGLTLLAPPTFGDLWVWEAPHLLDTEDVRLGGHLERPVGKPVLRRVDPDLLAVARQHHTAGFRLLDTAQAHDLIGPDGIVQPGHPMRSGTSLNPHTPAYAPDEPTHVQGAPPRQRPPMHHGEGPSPQIARMQALAMGGQPLGTDGWTGA